jgi:hypothetical protein
MLWRTFGRAPPAPPALPAGAAAAATAGALADATATGISMNFFIADTRRFYPMRQRTTKTRRAA